MAEVDADRQPEGVSPPAKAAPAANDAAGFVSILDPEGDSPAAGADAGTLRDLNLDQIIAAVTAGRERYDLAPFFAAPMVDAETAVWRHAVFRDLESPALRAAVEQFAVGMRQCREALAVADRLYYALQKQFWHHEAARLYCETLRALSHELDAAGVRSPGFRPLGRHVADLVGACDFRVL